MLKGGAGFPEGEQGTQGEELPFFKVKHLTSAHTRCLLVDSDNTVSRATAARLGAFVFPPDTIVFAKVGAALLLNRFCALGRNACIDNNMIGFVANNPCVIKQFMLYRLSIIEFGKIANPGAVPSLSAEDIGNITVSLPPMTIQLDVANYLDCETARIDALIAAKERMLRLLVEKRRAIITRAVARGVNPSAPLRDSGVPWLGDIPVHWQAKRFRFHLEKIEQGWSPQCDNSPADEHEWGVLKAGCVNGWAFNPSENKRLPDTVQPILQYEVREGDVLMSRANTTSLLASTALVREVRPRLLLCDKLYRLILDTSILCKEYFVWYLQSPAGRYEFERDATGASSSMQNIGQDSVRNLWLTLPPLDEQHSIVTYIDATTAKLDTVRSATEHTIALLKERRAALIAAAVTGQLTVPELSNPIPSEEEMECSSTT
jgi:type I restriction enzyme S subunit